MFIKTLLRFWKFFNFLWFCALLNIFYWFFFISFSFTIIFPINEWRVWCANKQAFYYYTDWVSYWKTWTVFHFILIQCTTSYHRICVGLTLPSCSHSNGLSTSGAAPVPELIFELIVENLEETCWENIQKLLQEQEAQAIEYDEDTICDVCRSVRIYSS